MEALLIETAAVNQLKLVLERNGQVFANISTNDKTPSLDGTLCIYNSPRIKKGNIRGFITVQVKGKEVKQSDLNKTQIHYKVEVDDLRNFRHVGGVIFFIVCMSDYNHYKVYYNALLPFDLEQIIAQTASQKTKNLKFHEFPSDDEELMMMIFNIFIDDSKKQYSTARPVSLDDIKKYDTITFSVPTDFEHAFRVTTYIYGKQDGEVGIPLSKGVIESVSSENLDIPVMIDGKVYFEKISANKTAHSTIIKFGRGFSIDVEKERIDYTSKGNLQERLRDLQFLLALEKCDELVIGDVLKSKTITIKKLNVNDIEQTLEAYKLLQTFLDDLKVKESLNLDLVIDQDKLEQLHMLQVAMTKGFPVNISEKTEYKTFTSRFRIANLVIGLLVEKIDGDKYTARNFFDVLDKDCSISMDGVQHIPASIYVMLKKQDFIELSNIDYQVVEESIFSIPYTEEYGQTVNQLILEMLLAYDENNEPELLGSILAIAKWLTTKENNKLYQLNYLQAIKRSRVFSTDEIKLLQEMKTREYGGDKLLNVLVGISILLGNTADVDYYLGEMGEQDREAFKKWPIYKLVK